MIIRLTKKDLAKIDKFSREVSKARRGRDYKNNDVGKHRILRQSLGIIGEVGVCKATGIGKVDFNIYKTGDVKKNCSYDLAPGIHVKTASSKYRNSKYDGWLLSKSEDCVTNPTKDDIIYLAYADLEGTVEVIGFVKALDITDFLRPPINKKLAHKTALYYKDIKDIIVPI